jgi:hypothetical protein
MEGLARDLHSTPNSHALHLLAQFIVYINS